MRKFDKCATKALADLMVKTVGDQKNISDLGFQWTNKEEAVQILEGIRDKLLDGANPNAIPGKSLLAVLCAYPYEDSPLLLQTIGLALSKGADLKTPLKRIDIGVGYTEIFSPVMALFLMPLSAGEIHKRLYALISPEGRVYKQHLMDILTPKVNEEFQQTDTYVAVHPLLCCLSNAQHYDLILSFMETYLDSLKRSELVRDSISLFHHGKRLLSDDAFLWLCKRARPSSPVWEFMGNTPLHSCIKNVEFGTPLARVVQRLMDNGAVLTPITRNVWGFTPYGMACVYGKLKVLKKEPFGDRDRSEEFSDLSRDRMGRLLLTRTLHSCLFLGDERDPSNKEYIERAVRLLLEYSQCENMPEYTQEETVGILSDVLARIIAKDMISPLLEKLIIPLLEAGAKPGYTLSGLLPTWKIATLKYGSDSAILKEMRKRMPDLSDTDFCLH